MLHVRSVTGNPSQLCTLTSTCLRGRTPVSASTPAVWPLSGREVPNKEAKNKFMFWWSERCLIWIVWIFFLRSKMKVQGASALRLLQTPKVERKTPRKTSRPSSSAPTPQSILKVRNLINSSTKLDSPDTSNKGMRKSSIPNAVNVFSLKERFVLIMVKISFEFDNLLNLIFV